MRKPGTKTLYPLLLVLLLGGCATGGGGGSPFSGLTSFLNTYDAAKKDFEQGHVMEARERILAMDKSREDYAKAQVLLRTKVEPARLRLLHHYQSKAEKAAHSGIWYRAARLYTQAAEFSTKPEAYRKQSRIMELRMRQERMELLIKARRQEDADWLDWPSRYEASKGVEPNDEALVRMRENYQDALDDRIQLAYWEAKRYLRKGLPELAYVQIESHLRLSPDSVSGKRLLKDIREAMPSQISVPAEKARRGPRPTTRQVSHQSRSEAVTAAGVEARMKAGDWQEARRLAVIYRREGGKDAGRLLKRVEAGIEKAAASLYERGSVAFRQEKIDKAVEYWQQAVDLMPEESEYVDALRRAEQMQERLRLLRGTDSSGNGK